MDYTGKALEALGKALSEKETEISMLRWDRDSLKTRVEELEAQLKLTIETTVTTTVTHERMV